MTGEPVNEGLRKAWKETIMTKPRILVTGATGKTGSVVVTELLKAGYPVRALVHRKDDRSARLKAQGVELAVADLSDTERIADSLRDVQGAYYCPPLDPYMIQGATAFAVAAKEAKLEHIVSLTQWLSSPSHPSLMTRQHWLAVKGLTSAEATNKTTGEISCVVRLLGRTKHESAALILMDEGRKRVLLIAASDLTPVFPRRKAAPKLN
jgi:NADPH:quinone reductase-like Zn-dependent oxidoreductase